MSQQIDTALVKQYHDNIERLLQQRGSRLRSAVRVETQKGEEAFWEQVGSVEASPVLTRHGDSPLVNTPHARRRVTLFPVHDVGDMIDDFDKVKMLADPTSVYVQNFVDAPGRAMDDEIIAAFSGTAYTGKAGGTSVTSGWDVVNEDVGTANSGMNIAKLVRARQLMLEAQNEPNAEPW